MTPLQMKQTPKEVKKKSFCLKMKGDHLQLDENHNYFYRVQGQEGVSGIEWFDFALLTDPHIGLNGLFVQRIYFKKKNIGVWVAAKAYRVLFQPPPACLLFTTVIIVFIFSSPYKSINIHDCLLIISLHLTWTLPSKWCLRNLGGGVLCHWYLASTGSPFCYLSAGHGNVEPLHRSAVARHGEL